MPTNTAPIRVNAYRDGRSVDFLTSYGASGNISGAAATEVAFTSPAPVKTIVRCFAEKDLKGHEYSHNVPANGGKTKVNVGAFKSWKLEKNPY
ncbi:predicted protein [Chaetomium globosum CBS 148.51]|uniref:Uncharacterized protein n=1 Tax=Chaetomium globosum (strain ATCC 6205 / CBS 148.51 / DSM 1962 / NBRC 6347 / NRRL 1970) TaxID=306901 RepID=Q2GRV7_CHAGB|nr:uncharacterized protein CHGG_09297 [Chaetomium globosum CBS 148.51]EAQ85283.1 predicted protein [Chaetomium globosum CBS 148.51]